MKLNSKIWLLTAGVLAAAVALDALVSLDQLERGIRLELERDARNIKGILMSTRRIYHQQFLASDIALSEKTLGFLPAHAMSRISADFPNWSQSGLRFNNVSDRPRNPYNKADQDELAAMQWFRQHPAEEERLTRIVGEGGQSLFHYTAPIWTEAYCLKCHGERNQAPSTISANYDSAYGYRVGELRGVMSIKLPEEALRQREYGFWWQRFLLRIGGYVVLLLLLGASLNRLVSTRLARLERSSQRIAAGNFSERVDLGGSDEVGRLAGQFNLMAEAVDLRNEAMERSEQRYQELVRRIPSGVYRLRMRRNHGYAFDYVSPRFCALIDVDAEACLADAQTATARVHPEDLQSFLRNNGRVEVDLLPSRSEARFLVAGTTRWMLTESTPTMDGNGDLLWDGVMTDITERKEAEDRLRLTQLAFANSQEAMLVTDADGRILEVNPAFSEITGYTHDEAIGKNPSMLQSGKQSAAFYADMWQTLLEEDRWEGEFWNRRKDGRLYIQHAKISAVRDAGGQIIRYVGVASDVTLIRESQRRVEHLAYYDFLTNLPNRSLFADRLKQAIAQTDRHGKLLAVAYLDLDGFKPVNDAWGHQAGDLLLMEVARRLQSCVRAGDSVARMGGDEFVLLFGNANDVHEIELAIRRILAAISLPINIGGRVAGITASIGLTIYPNDGQDADTLLRHADQAMYAAKQLGKNRFHLFDSDSDRRLQEHHEILGRIKQGIAAGEFRLYYQPKVDMRSGKVVGAEALIRWQHPQRGLLLPGDFLPIVDSSDFAIKLGEWVIEQALRQMTAWSGQQLELPVSVNISGAHLQDPSFLPCLSRLLDSYPAVRPQLLDLEILETTAMEDIAATTKIIDACAALGVGFALDDFGTGYSSLTYFRRLPTQWLKIDQSFVRNMLDDADDLAIVEGVISLAHTFQRQVIAEGVEAVEHGIPLMQFGCNQAQGYAIARPMPAAQIPEWIRNWQSPQAWQAMAKTHWSKDDVPLLLAGVHHRRWVERVAALCRDAGSRDTPPPMTAQLCRFGQWLYGPGKAHYGQLDSFRAMEATHSRIHVLGIELLALRGSDAKAALARLPELYALRDQLEASLGNLRSATALTEA